MVKKSEIQLFESKRVRTHWDEEKEKWLVAIVDVVAALTESQNPQVYSRVLKKRLKAEGNETVASCNALKMLAPDGKMRLTDVADTEQILRLIQSIPSPKAEPFKLWLAQQGGKVAKVAQLELEARTGRKVVTGLNAKHALEAVKKSGKE